MSKVSVIIPSYQDRYLNKTIESVLAAAKGDIEIIVFLDGSLPDKELVDDHRVVHISSGENVGMRCAINSCAKEATGKYLMKLDAHCQVSDNFDHWLKKNCDENQVSVPTRFNLNPEKWERYGDPINNLGISFPRRLKKEVGFRAKLLDYESSSMLPEIMIFQGSCWFMHKSFFKKIGGLDEIMFKSFGMEAHEISMKAWLVNEGRVVRDKHVWYSHYSPKKLTWKRKPKHLKSEMLSNMRTAFKLDMLNDWPGQNKTFKWLIDKWPLGKSWPVNWYTYEFIKDLKERGYI